MDKKADFKKRQELFLKEVNKLIKKHKITFGTEIEYRSNGIVGKLILKEIKNG